MSYVPLALLRWEVETGKLGKLPPSLLVSSQEYMGKNTETRVTPLLNKVEGKNQLWNIVP